MILKRAPRDRNTRRLELVDTLMNIPVRWRDESRAVDESYRIWHSAIGRDRDGAFEEYVGALDREAHAACGYRRVLEQRMDPSVR